MEQYIVVQYRNGEFDGVLSGMGKNKGKLDSEHSRSAAYRHAKALRSEEWRKHAKLTYKVEKSLW